MDHVARALPAFDGGEAHFRAWVFTIARRRAIDWARRRRRRPPTAALDRVDIPTGDTTSVLVADIAAQAAAINLLRRLSPEQAEAIAYRVIAGLSVADTAQALGKTDGAVRALCHRGLHTLASLIAQPQTRRPSG